MIASCVQGSRRLGRWTSVAAIAALLAVSWLVTVVVWWLSDLDHGLAVLTGIGPVVWDRLLAPHDIDELADRPAIQARLMDSIGRSYQFLGRFPDRPPHGGHYREF